MQRNNPFLSENENKLNNDYISKGFFVGKIQELEKINSIRNSLIDITKKELKIKGNNSIHCLILGRITIKLLRHI